MCVRVERERDFKNSAHRIAGKSEIRRTGHQAGTSGRRVDVAVLSPKSVAQAGRLKTQAGLLFLV